MNRVLEDLLKCFVSIILRISLFKDIVLDLYSNCLEWRVREIGVYKNFCFVDVFLIDFGRRINVLFFIYCFK